MKANTLVLGLLALGLVSCNGYFSGMDIPNEYDPDIEAVMGDVNQYPSLIQGAYVNYWTYMLDYNTEPLWNMGTNADIFTPGAGNWDMRTYTYLYKGFEKPEISNTDPSASAPKSRWYNFYSVINTVRNMIKVMDSTGIEYKEGGEDATFKVYANCYMLLGLAYSEMALCFDKCFMLTEKTEEVTVEDLKPAKEIRDLALGYLDKCIAICGEHSFTNFSGTMPGGATGTSEKLAQMANFAAARLLAYFPRTNKDEAPDWNKVLSYAKNGLQTDIAATMPEESNYDMWTQAIASYYTSQWTRPSMRIIKMMAPDDPNAKWPRAKDYSFDVNGPYAQITICPDARLNKYFQYTDTAAGSGTNFSESYSSYTFAPDNRFCLCGQPSGEGQIILFTKIESDLIYAEACANTSDLSKAADLVNLSRSVNGGLSDISAASSKDAIIRAIYYEMFVECCFTTGSTGWYNRRRTPVDEFQLTTMSYRELPVPKVELDFYGLDDYTFGGPRDAYKEYEF